MKTCSKCKISKPATDFYKNKVMADGLHSFCIVCHKAANIARKAIKRVDPEFKAKELAYKKEYRQRTVEQRKKYMQEWHAKNAESQSDYRKQYILGNPDYFRIYRQENKAMLNAKTRKRQAAKIQRTPKWLTDIDFERMQNEYKLAALLTKVTNSPWEVDHIIPLQGKVVSGFHVPSNLRVIESKDNRIKANRFEV
jgi:hypothetical protein